MSGTIMTQGAATDAETLRRELKEVMPSGIAPDVLANERLNSAGFVPPEKGLLTLSDKQHSAVVEEAAALLHEAWRDTRLELASGNYDPRIKDTKDEKWVAASGSTQVDIANTEYKDLPADWQTENRKSAEVALKHLVAVLENSDSPEKGLDLSALLQRIRNDAGNRIHEAWVDRNPWASDDLKKPFAELPRDEQRKDLLVLESAVRAYSKELRPDRGEHSHLVVRIVNVAEPIGPLNDGAPVFSITSGIALEVISNSEFMLRRELEKDQRNGQRQPCPLPKNVAIEDLVREGAIPTTQTFGDRVQGILYLTPTQVSVLGSSCSFRTRDGDIIFPGQAVDLTDVRYHNRSHGRVGVLPYGLDLSNPQLDAAKSVYEPPGPEQVESFFRKGIRLLNNAIGR